MYMDIHVDIHVAYEVYVYVYYLCAYTHMASTEGNVCIFMLHACCILHACSVCVVYVCGYVGM